MVIKSGWSNIKKEVKYMKKVYLFYLIDYEINLSKYPGIDEDQVKQGKEKQYTFYAWTPNKKIRNRFKSMRNMSLFFEKVRTVEDDAEFEEFTKNYDQFLLEDRALTTKVIRNDRIARDVVLVLSTSKEIDFVIFNYFDSYMDNDIFWSDTVPLLRPDCFVSPYKEALEYLRYSEVIEWLCPLEENPLPFNPIDIDGLAIYVHIYNNIYRKDIDRICESMNFSEYPIARKTTKK